MKRELDIAKTMLAENEYTCVLYSHEATYSSIQRGVKPLLEFLDSGDDFSTFYAADKVVGAGAAHLYVLLGVKAVWADVLGESAAEILRANRIPVYYSTLVPHIINRKGDGMCPIEIAVKGIRDSQEALEVIRQTLKTLEKPM